MSSNPALVSQKVINTFYNDKKINKEFLNWISKRKSSVSGIEFFLKERSQRTDNLILDLWKRSLLFDKKNLSLFAVGGYGRKELHPYSDIDLLILFIETIDKKTKSQIESFISGLWDFNLDIGHSVRSFKEEEKIVSSDLQAFTNLLESRFLFGDEKLRLAPNIILEKKSLWKKETFFNEIGRAHV